MFKWIFQTNSQIDRILRAGGVGGFILAPIITAFIKEIKANDISNALVSLSLSIVLFLPILFKEKFEHCKSLKMPALWLGIGYFLTSIMYSFEVFGYRAPYGISGILDVFSSIWYLIAWFYFIELDNDETSRNNGKALFIALAILLVLFGLVKSIVDFQNDLLLMNFYSRALLNLCNGAIMLSLYFQMKRIYPSPGMFFNILIILFGCSQIAAYAKDIPEKTNLDPIIWQSASEGELLFANLSVTLINWILLLGKIALGLYLIYLIFDKNVKVTKS